MKSEDEFLAWFEGFTQRIKNRPSREEWAQIIAQLGEIGGASTVKAWLDGRTRNIKGAPNEKAWREIKSYLDAARKGAGNKKTSLAETFESFEKKAGTLGKTARPKSSYPGSGGSSGKK